ELRHRIGAVAAEQVNIEATLLQSCHGTGGIRSRAVVEAEPAQRAAGVAECNPLALLRWSNASLSTQLCDEGRIAKAIAAARDRALDTMAGVLLTIFRGCDGALGCKGARSRMCRSHF